MRAFWRGFGSVLNIWPAPREAFEPEGDWPPPRCHVCGAAKYLSVCFRCGRVVCREHCVPLCGPCARERGSLWSMQVPEAFDIKHDGNYGTTDDGVMREG